LVLRLCGGMKDNFINNNNNLIDYNDNQSDSKSLNVINKLRDNRVETLHDQNKFLINNMLIDREDNLIQISKTKRNSKI